MNNKKSAKQGSQSIKATSTESINESIQTHTVEKVLFVEGSLDKKIYKSFCPSESKIDVVNVVNDYLIKEEKLIEKNDYYKVSNEIRNIRNLKTPDNNTVAPCTAILFLLTKYSNKNKSNKLYLGIIDNDYNSNRIQDVLSACKESGIIPENSKLNQKDIQQHFTTTNETNDLETLILKYNPEIFYNKLLPENIPELIRNAKEKACEIGYLRYESAKQERLNDKHYINFNVLKDNNGEPNFLTYKEISDADNPQLKLYEVLNSDPDFNLQAWGNIWGKNYLSSDILVKTWEKYVRGHDFTAILAVLIFELIQQDEVISSEQTDSEEAENTDSEGTEISDLENAEIRQIYEKIVYILNNYTTPSKFTESTVYKFLKKFSSLQDSKT